MCWVWKQRRARLEVGNDCNLVCLWAVIFYVQFWLFLNTSFSHTCSCGCFWAPLVSTCAISVVSENLLFPHVQFRLFLSRSGFLMCDCSCFWAVVYSCSCFWVALVSLCIICVCFRRNLFIIYITVVDSKQFCLPYVQLSPTFTVICPAGILILYYNTDTTHYTPPSTRLPNYILCHRSQQILISYRKFYCKTYSFTVKQSKVYEYYYICASSIEHRICFWK